MTTAQKWDSATPSPAVLRAGSVLDLVMAAGRPVVLPELASVLDLPRSSAANICSALTDLGYLRLTPDGYVLGSRLLELGEAYLATLAPVSDFNTYCRSQLASIPYTLQLATLDGAEVLYLGKHDGTAPVMIASRIGHRLPANCTALGKAMLASLPDGELSDLLGTGKLPALTARSITDVDELREELVRTRERGYAIDDEETTVGIMCFATVVSAIPSRAGTYAVSSSALKAAMTPDVRTGVLETLRQVAAAVSGVASAA